MLLNKRIPFWFIFNKIKVELLFVSVIAMIVYFITHLFREEIPPMPINIPAFLGTAISIILSFKLNQSYDRWWEARKIWGTIVNESRNLVLQLQSFVAKGNEGDIRTIAYRQIAWCFSLGNALRELNSAEGLDRFLSHQEIDGIKQHSNKPLAIQQLNAGHIRALRQKDAIDAFSHVQVNTTITNLVNAMGMAERIKSTVFPATYRLFLHFFIYLFVVALSISLSGIESYFEIPLLLVISSVFFLLERTATHLQDPFNNKPTDTAMTAIATTIEINLKQLVGDAQVPKPASQDKFYLM
jgi:ion channel-forming bestrophin family protein